MNEFIKTLKGRDDVITEFDNGLWSSLVDFVTVGKETRTITFKDGTEITI